MPKNGRIHVENFRPFLIIFFVTNWPCQYTFYLFYSNKKVPKCYPYEVLNIFLHYYCLNHDLKKCVFAFHVVSHVRRCLVSPLPSEVDYYSGYVTINVELPRKTNSLIKSNSFNSHYCILELFFEWSCPEWNVRTSFFKNFLVSPLPKLSYGNFRRKVSPRNALETVVTSMVVPFFHQSNNRIRVSFVSFKMAVYEFHFGIWCPMKCCINLNVLIFI